MLNHHSIAPIKQARGTIRLHNAASIYLLPCVIFFCLVWLACVLWFGSDFTYVGSPLSTMGSLVAGCSILALLGRKTFGKDEVSRQWFWIGSAVVLTVACSIAILWFAPTAEQNLGLDGFFIGADKERYERYGWLVAQEGLGTLGGLPLRDVGPVIVTATAYTLFGRSVVAVAVAQVLFHAWVSIGLYKVVSRLHDRDTARLAMVLWVVLPLPWFYASFPGKDIPVAALLLSAVNTATGLLKSQAPRRLLKILWLGTMGFLIVLFRTNMLLVSAVSLAVILILFRRKSTPSFTRLTVLSVFLGGIMIGWIVLGRDMSELAGSISIGSTEDVLSRWKFGATERSLSLRLYWDKDWRHAYLIALRLPFSIWFPFPPLAFGTLVSTLNSINVWLLGFLAPPLAMTLANPRRQRGQLRRLVPLWVPLLAISLALSAGLPYMQSRYAIPAYPYVAGLAALGFTGQHRLVCSYLVAGGLFVLALIAYIVFK